MMNPTALTRTASSLLILGMVSPLALGQQQTSGQVGMSARPRLARAVDDQLIVKTLPGTDIQALLDQSGATLLRETGPGTYLLSTGANANTTQILRNHAGTAWSERNYFLNPPETHSCMPSADPGIQGCTIAFFDGDPAPERYYEQPTTDIIQLGDAQSMSSGFTSIVAVIDTGIDPNHSVFAGRVYSPGYDFVDELPFGWDVGNGIDDDHDGYVDEAWGHGTHASGIIVLINPDAQILPLRVLDSDGNGTAFNVARAIHAAVDAGADVINLSLGMTSNSKAVSDAILRAHEMDIDVVTSAGNTAGRVLFPGRLDDVITVAALDETDHKTTFSSFGPAVEISAPGQDIYSAMPGESWAWWSGTSMACAVVSGGLSLLNSIHGDPVQADAWRAVKHTGVNVDATNAGYHDLLGDGRIDVEAGALYVLYDDLDD